MYSEVASHIEVPLGKEAHRWAQQFADEQLSGNRKRVYLNTLAVYAAHRHLQWLGIETDLEQSDSWHPVLRSRWNVADLVIPGIGKLECRPVLPGETTVTLPAETTEDRFGYLAIQFREQLDYGEILGFAEANTVASAGNRLAIASLQSLETLIGHLERKRQRNALAAMAQETIDVGRWLRNKLEMWDLSSIWVPLSGPALATEMRDSSFFEFDSIALRLRQKNGIQIPPEAASSRRDIQMAQSRLRLYVATWPPDNTAEAEWPLLLVLNPARGSKLSQAFRLIVRDQTDILIDSVLEPESKRSYLVTQVAGTVNEPFLVTIATEDGKEDASFLFEFSLEQLR